MISTIQQGDTSISWTVITGAGVCAVLLTMVLIWAMRVFIPRFWAQLDLMVSTFEREALSQRQLFTTSLESESIRHENQIKFLIDTFTHEREKDRVSRHEVADKLATEMLNLGTKIDRATQRIKKGDE